MTELQSKYISLDKEKAVHDAWFDEYYKVRGELFDELGLGGHFQDEDGIVYMAVKPNGRFVPYFDKSIDRTRREGEARGDLSMKKAEELGYTIKK